MAKLDELPMVSPVASVVADTENFSLVLGGSLYQLYLTFGRGLRNHVSISYSACYRPIPNLPVATPCAIGARRPRLGVTR
jgi:hypothetical protein